MTQPGWQERTTRVIAAEVRRYRLARGLSAQQLADECGRIGFPIARSVLANLENGRRESVTTAELQVLAAALGVPPVLLLFPIGYVPAVEILPGTETEPWAAREWFTGNSRDPADPGAIGQMGADSPIVLWNEHLQLNERIPALVKHLDVARKEERAHRAKGLPDAKRWAAEVEDIEYEMGILIPSLRRVRARMRELGMTPPDLHPGSARALGEEA